MKKKAAAKRVFTLTNLLAISRIPLAIAAVIAYPNMLIFCIFVALALFTDIIDGPIARRTGTVSTLGAILDGLSDKLFFFILLLFLVILAKLQVWQMLLLIIQDLWMAVLAVYVLLHPRRQRIISKVQARPLGKLTSIGQSAAVFWLYLGWPYFVCVLYPTVVMAVFAAADYTLFVRKHLAGKGQ